MINEEFYKDLRHFPKQFAEGFELAKNLKVTGIFTNAVLSGMGGSSLFVELFNDLAESQYGNKFNLEVSRSYYLPKGINQNTLVIICSYSGNTEETLSCLEEAFVRHSKVVVFTTGGKLLNKALELHLPLYKIPTGVQPRLSTGYFIAGLVRLLSNVGLIPDLTSTVLTAANKIENSFNEDEAKAMAEELLNKVPVIYATDENSSLARIAKVKFNENSKIQAWWNFFPEVNHNEMVGYTNMLMNPYFILYKSKFTNERNKKRIDIFAELMRGKGLPVKIIELRGDNIFEEILNAYYFIDHVAVYLAEAYGIDPEPVKMVEDFKTLMEQ